MSSKSGFKQDLFARVGKASGNGNRLELLEFLAQGERTVEALARVSGLSVANTSQSLQQLRQAGLVTTRREGLHVHYRLSGEDVVQLMGCLRRVAETHMAEVDRLVDAYLTVKEPLIYSCGLSEAGSQSRRSGDDMLTACRAAAT